MTTFALEFWEDDGISVAHLESDGKIDIRTSAYTTSEEIFEMLMADNMVMNISLMMNRGEDTPDGREVVWYQSLGKADLSDEEHDSCAAHVRSWERDDAQSFYDQIAEVFGERIKQCVAMQS